MFCRNYRSLLAFFALSLSLTSCQEILDFFDDLKPKQEVEDVDTRLVAQGLVSPVGMVVAPEDHDRLFIIDQVGLIRVVEDGTLLSQPFLDIRDRIVELSPAFDERGLLGLAFHPDYQDNGRFFVYYSAPPRPEAPDDWNHTSHLSEFQVSSGNPNRANRGSENVLLQIDQPQANHNGGTVLFGPDGYLYLSLGDGGGGGDDDLGHVPDWYEVNGGGNGQDVEANLLGNIIRIDVDGGSPYGIPPDNPFVGKEGRDEIFAFGLRNPYRMSFDRATGDLLAGDAGQELYEEVDLIVRGGNYGWNVKEGRHCFNAAEPTEPLEDCPDVDPQGNPLIDPVIEFKNSKNFPEGLGLVVVGGHVYRGDELEGLEGRYIFGVAAKTTDEPSGDLYYAIPNALGFWPVQDVRLKNRSVNHLQHFLKGFGEDHGGELYITVSDFLGPQGNTGKVYRLFNPKDCTPP